MAYLTTRYLSSIRPGKMQARQAGMLAIVVAVGLTALLTLLGSTVAGLPALGTLLDPAEGLYSLARATAHNPHAEEARIPGLQGEVDVYFNERGVPHIYASQELDAVRAFGYVIARDRLFQMDFISRAASGRLSSILGPDAVEADRFLRRTGMETGARLNAHRIEEDGGQMFELIMAFCDGANAYIDSLEPRHFPLEYRLTGSRPDRCTLMMPLRTMQYMSYDLTYRSDNADYGVMRERLTDEEFAELYPAHSTGYFVPIVPEEGGSGDRSEVSASAAATVQNRWLEFHRSLGGTMLEGYRPGKGSNNWVVSPERSATGGALLAGDMHLGLTLPAIWYEAHMATPEFNIYGVSIPGAPLPVQSFSNRHGWAFTNTGSDQIDHYRLTLDESGRRYLFDGEYRDLAMQIDTIRVRGGRDVVDTLFYSRWGPVLVDEDADAIAIRWTAHRSNDVLHALYRMTAAGSMAEFDDALRSWHAPMQNIAYADAEGNIAIRSTGSYPIRAGGTGEGILEGSTRDADWSAEIPFEELPHAVNPSQGYLSSTNQQPTAEDYPHYLGHDWRPGYRSIRINELLSTRAAHSVEDMKVYQADVYVIQHDLFLPILDTLSELSSEAAYLRDLLREWDGFAMEERIEPLILHYFLKDLERLTWDEKEFVGGVRPQLSTLHRLIVENPNSRWFDREGTDSTETAIDVLRHAMESANRRLVADFGEDSAAWRWGDYNRVVFRHITRAPALSALWRGPYEWRGFEETLSPARGNPIEHSASWRVVLDFSTSPVTAYGIYPGGQSGNPLHATYAAHIDDYLNFRYYRLEFPADPRQLREYDSLRRMTFHP